MVVVDAGVRMLVGAETGVQTPRQRIHRLERATRVGRQKPIAAVEAGQAERPAELERGPTIHTVFIRWPVAAGPATDNAQHTGSGRDGAGSGRRGLGAAFRSPQHVDVPTAVVPRIEIKL